MSRQLGSSTACRHRRIPGTLEACNVVFRPMRWSPVIPAWGTLITPLSFRAARPKALPSNSKSSLQLFYCVSS
jgi:hypothetical protein